MGKQTVSIHASNPIYQRLTRNIDARRQRTQVRLAALIPAGVVLAVSLVVYLRGLADILSAAAAAVVVIGLLAMPVAVSAASAVLAHGDVHGETFGLIQLSPLSDPEIRSGLVQGIRERLKPLRYAADSLAICTVVVPIVTWITAALIEVTALGTATLNMYGNLVPPLAGNALVLLVLVWAGTHLTAELGALAGVYSALRLSETSVSTTSVTAGCIVLASEAVWMLLSAGAVLSSGEGIFGGMLFCSPVFFPIIPMFGTTIVDNGINAALRRMRPAGS